MIDFLRFVGSFLRHPIATGAIAPSSRWLARRMVSEIGLDQAETVVELGPGTGAFTGAILEAKRPEAEYMALELNSGFAEKLSLRHPAARVINDSAENLGGHLGDLGRAHADAILCGLPWASFPKTLQDRIMGSVVDSLPDGGRFATFAYIHALWLPSARRFRHFLEDHFSEVETSPVVWWNLPPAFVYRCAK